MIDYEKLLVTSKAHTLPDGKHHTVYVQTTFGLTTEGDGIVTDANRDQLKAAIHEHFYGDLSRLWFELLPWIERSNDLRTMSWPKGLCDQMTQNLTAVLTAAKTETLEKVVAAAGIEPATQGFSVPPRGVSV
jgi:hypothetical protein